MPTSIRTSRSTRALESGEAKLWVLLVGVNQYDDERLPKLAYSALDCQGLGEAIAAATQTFPQKSVILHHDYALPTGDSKISVRQLSEQVSATGRMAFEAIAKLRGMVAQPPKRDLVRSSLLQIVSEAKPQDTVLFYFSGHGVLEADTQQAVLCLTDTNKDDLGRSGFGVQELLTLLSQCQAHQQLVWLDACHSGGMSFRVAKGETQSEGLPNPTPQLMELLRQRAAQSKGFYALLSCDHNQQSWEFPELGHGVFTYFLMRGLLGEAADAQGAIEADALYKYVYYQTLQYIDKTNQQLRLINQQKRGRGDTQLQQEYPLQTPKRIVEGVGELILGVKPPRPEAKHPRQALIVDGFGSTQATLDLCKTFSSTGAFELTYFPHSGKDWTGVREAIQTCLQSGKEFSQQTPEASIALLYFRGKVEQSETGDALLVLKEDIQISRSWLRQELRRSPIAQQVIILDCPGATDLKDWIEDLQIDRGQCLIAAAASALEPEQFTQALLETLTVDDLQTGLSAAGWIAQLQTLLAGTTIVPQVWLSGTQGVIEVLPEKSIAREADSSFDLGLCPYLGLRSFQADDAPFFFGREELTQTLITTFHQQSFLAVVGASGSGKSSVVHAGLVAQLRQGKQIPGSDRWWVRSLRPGTRPLDSLAKRLVDSGTEKERTYQQLQLEGMLYQGVEGFVHWLRSRPEPMIVLIIDQFEELFTLSANEDRQRFLDLVLGAVEFAGDRFKLVITLRTDFIAPCLETPELATRLQRSSLLVSPQLTDESYQQVITRPAEKVGLTVESELVEVLLQELNHGAGDLPLLEFVLEQVWQHRQPGKLTLNVYQQQIGGLKGALERKAQAVYDGLDDAAKACARWIFLSLTQLGEGTEDTRRRILKSTLVVNKYPLELVDRTLQALTTAKLIVLNSEDFNLPTTLEQHSKGTAHTPDPRSRSAPKDSPIPDPRSPIPNPQPPIPVTIEVAHEILIRHWSTLRWWLEENRSRLRAQRQIEQAALQWKQSGEQSDFLLRGVRLDAAEEIYVKYTDELSQDVQQFIEAGLQARLKEQQHTKRQLKRAQIAIAAISTLGAITAVFGSVAYLQRQHSQVNEITALNALSESQKLSHQQLESLITAVRSGEQLQRLNSWGINTTTRDNLQTQTIATLQQAVEGTQETNRLEGHSQRVNQISIIEGAIASASDDATLRLWQPDGTLIRELKGHEDRVTSVAFSTDKNRLASGSADNTVKIWNLADGSIAQTFTVGSWITDVAWSQDDRLLAASTRNNTIELWDTSTGQRLRSLSGHTGWVNAIAFSPTDPILASASEDGTIRVWNTNSETSIRTLTGHQGRVTNVAFSHDGKTIASTGEDGTIKLWTLDNQPPQTIEAHPAQVNSVQFSADDRLLVSASADGTIKVWNVADGALLTTLSGHGSDILSAAFTPDGRSIVSAGADKSIRLWNIAGIGTLPTTAYTAAFSLDGNTFASAGWDGTIALWQPNGTTATQIRTIAAHQAPVNAIAFSRQILASGSDDQTVKLWDVNSGSLLKTLTGHQGKITSIAFSPDGDLLATASDDKTIRLWNVTTGQAIATLTGHQDSVTSVAFSPDGKTIASGSNDNTVKLWQLDGTLVRTFEGQGLAIATIAFSPDGATLASTSWDNTIALWDVSNGNLRRTLTGHQDGVTSLAFSPDGRLLASGSADHTIKFWDTQNGSFLKTLLGTPDPLRTIAFSPDGKTLLTASEAAGVQLWDLDLEDLLQRGCDRLHNYIRNAMRQTDLCR